MIYNIDEKMTNNNKQKITVNIQKIFTHRLLTVSETSKILKISEKQLIRNCKNNKISFFKVGKQYRFFISDILLIQNE